MWGLLSGHSLRVSIRLLYFKRNLQVLSGSKNIQSLKENNLEEKKYVEQLIGNAALKPFKCFSQNHSYALPRLYVQYNKML